MTQRSLRGWIWIHTWTSLVCTLFLLLICITGLPLVLTDEIEDLLDDGLPYANVADGTAHLKLDEFVAKGRAMFPGETVLSVSSAQDEPKIVVLMASSWEAFKANRKAMHWIRFDAHTGQVLKQSKPFDGDGPTFLGTMLSLHRDLYAGLPGELFMGLMAVLFVLAIVSGVVIYGPFMRRLEFGTVRANRSTRLRWLDLHNLIGVTTLAWALVVGATGVLNEVSRPLFTLWQQTDVKAMLAPLRGKPVPETSELSSPQAAFDTVKAAFPHGRDQRGVSRLSLRHAVSLFDMDQGTDPADLAAVPAGSGRCQERCARLSRVDAVVPSRGGSVAPAAFR